MNIKYIFGFIFLFLQLGLVKAEKIITVEVCGSNTYGYYVTESHDYDREIHALRCIQGENEQCKWTTNPQVVVNNNNLIPLDLVFKDNLDNIIQVDNVALNNALNNQISNGLMSGSIYFSNLLIQFSITPVNPLSSCTNIVISITPCCGN